MNLRNKFKSFIWHYDFSYIALILIIVGVAIGVLVTAQWKTQPKRVTDPVVSYSSLIQTKKKLVEEQENLKTEIKKLNEESSQAQNTLKQFSDLKNKVEEVEKYESTIGLTEIEGEGVIITLDDSHKDNISSETITHAADLRDIVNFLWGQDTKAIEINGERVVFNTSIDCIVNTILINSTKTIPPFTIKAIGNPSQIANKFYDQNNELSEIYKRVAQGGLILNIEEKDNITIKPYDGSLKLNYISINE